MQPKNVTDMIRRGCSMIESWKGVFDENADNDVASWFGVVYHTAWWLFVLLGALTVVSPKTGRKVFEKLESIHNVVPWIVAAIREKKQRENGDVEAGKDKDTNEAEGGGNGRTENEGNAPSGTNSNVQICYTMTYSAPHQPALYVLFHIRDSRRTRMSSKTLAAILNIRLNVADTSNSVMAPFIQHWRKKNPNASLAHVAMKQSDIYKLRLQSGRSLATRNRAHIDPLSESDEEMEEEAEEPQASPISSLRQTRQKASDSLLLGSNQPKPIRP
ncbi:unnamed protein product [Caenorhabditis brenneri]